MIVHFFYSAAHIADIAGIINHDLQLLTNWAKQWLVKFNLLKTEAVLFTLKKLDFLPQLVFDNIPISFVDSHKHLGVTLSSNGQWHSRVENIANSASKILALLAEMLSTRCICPICFLLLSIHQWYGMDALNGTLKHFKRYKMKQLAL